MKKCFNLIFLLIAMALIQGCKTKQDEDPCSHYIPPPTANLIFRVFDAATHEDLYLTSQSNKLNPDSLFANQPCSEYNPLVKDATIYSIPTKNGLPQKQGYVFRFVNLRNPTVYEQPECSSIIVHWNSHDSDRIEWDTVPRRDGDCPAYQVLDQVFFNGVPIAPVYDTAYQYYPLYK